MELSTAIGDPGPSAHGVPVPSVAPPEVMTARQAARFLQVDEGVVLELAREGRLPGRRVGEEWRFSRAALID